MIFCFSFHNALDNIFRDLRVKGVGSQCKTTEVFINEEEDLWTSGALSTDTPLGLLRAVFFLNGKNFCLHGGEEHRNLRISQLERVRDPLTEHASKHCGGGFAQLHIENKVVPLMQSVKLVIVAMSMLSIFILENNPQKRLKVIISILSHVPKFPRIPKLRGIPIIQLGKIHLQKWLRTSVVRPMSRDKRLIVVSEPQVLQLYTKQAYQRKPFKNEQATCHLLGYVIMKGLTLNSKSHFKSYSQS